MKQQISPRKSSVARRALDAAAAATIERLDRLAEVVRRADSFDSIDAAARDAAAIQHRFRPIKGVADRAGEVWIDAEVRLGEELAKVPKAKGARAGGTKAGPRGAYVEPRDKTPSLAELGIAKKRAARAARLKAIPRAEREQFKAELKAADKAITPEAVLRSQRQRNKRDKKHATITAAFSADGPFDVVVIDPPWPVAKIDRDERPNQDAFDYPVMQPAEIEQFWQRELAHRVTKDCHLFMWTTQKYLPAALNLIGLFGFRYVFTMVWHKGGGFQPIDLPQYNCEFVVYGRCGSPLFVDTKDFNCCFEGPRREHSRKPDVFYDTVCRVTGGSRIDVFSRELRNGFAQYGNQPDAFSEVA